MLRVLQRKEIDTKKWDQCIQHAGNSLLYAQSVYLDHMAGSWDAVVQGDYEMVMPLPFRKKFGIRYVAMPAFVQQLGIFSAGAVSAPMIEAFVQKAQRHFRFADYHFNYANGNDRFQSRNNFILNLDAPYETLRSAYKQDLVKNLTRAQKFQLQYKPTMEYKNAILLYLSLYAQRQPSVVAEDYQHFERLCQEKPQQVVVRAVFEGGTLLATALCLKDAQRLYLLMSATTEKGRTLEANHWLLDRLIHEYSGTNTILDFEGSDVPGIAHFYKNFGTTNQPYYYARWNRLPWPLRMLKKE